jgi:hypothetical protein
MARIKIENSAARLIPVFIVLADYDLSASLADVWRVGEQYETRCKEPIVGTFTGDLLGLLRDLAAMTGAEMDTTPLASAVPVLLRLIYVYYGDTDIGFLGSIDDEEDEWEGEEEEYRRMCAEAAERLKAFSSIDHLGRFGIHELFRQWYEKDFLREVYALEMELSAHRT